MKILHQLIGLGLIALIMMVPTLRAQSTAQPNALAPLGLLRLKDNATTAAVAASKLSLDGLSPSNAPSGGASKAKKDNVDFITLEAGKQWSQSLRGSPKDPTYASFMVYGSQTTIIEVGGARLGLTASPMKNGLQLMYDDSATGTLQWKPLGYHLPLETYGGKQLGALPVLTVAIDPSAGVWHLYSGSRLLADHLPLIASRSDAHKFTVTAGKDGAWICGLVLSDENPLYQDDNFNGIDDAFEKQSRNGALLPTTASLAERQQLAQQWKAAQRTKAPPALFVQRPQPDSR